MHACIFLDIAFLCPPKPQFFHKLLCEVEEAHANDDDDLNQKLINARAFAFAQNLRGSLFALLLEQVR